MKSEIQQHNESPLSPEQQLAEAHARNQELEKRIKELEELALKDFLTKVYNRHGLEEMAKVLLSRAKEEKPRKEGETAEREERHVVVAMFDLDDFKKFNTDYGHLKADTVLKTAAEVLQSAIRGSDVVARFGGEEFVVIFTDATGDDIKKRFFDENTGRPQVGFTTLIEGDEIRVSFSGGMTEVRPDESFRNLQDILERANQAMRRAKEGGKDQIAHFEEESEVIS